MEDIIEIAFNKRLEEINLTSEEQEKILSEKKIYLKDIIDKIDNSLIIDSLLKYEEQQNKIDTAYSEVFYKTGFHDGFSLRNYNKNI